MKNFTEKIMERKLVNFFAKYTLRPTDIAYITKVNRHTLVKLKDGQELKTTIPMKYFVPALPEGAYLHITKGVIVASSEIEKIEKNCYTMRDGTQFTGRVRGAGEHKINRQLLEKGTAEQTVAQATNRLISDTVFQQFSIMDQLPLPFWVTELVFDDDAHNVDFIFRYCNEAMAKHEGRLREEILDQAHDVIFPHADKQWILTYMEVALTGKARDIQEVHPKTGANFTLHCFQPAKNLCACLLVVSE